MKRYIKSVVVPLYQYDKDVLRRIARDPRTSLDDLKSLAEHPDYSIQYFVSKNPAAADWFKEHTKLWRFSVDDDVRYGIDFQYSGSEYDGSNPEVITSLMEKTIKDAGVGYNGCYVHNLPSDTWAEGEECAYVEIQFSSETTYMSF